MITLQVFSFQINLFSLIAFLVGMLSGMAILFLIYLFNALVKLNKDAVKLNNRIQNISKEEIQKVISNYQEAFTDEKKRRGELPLDYFKSSIADMVNSIAKEFYPDSKRPLSELTLNELILLDHYIIDKIDNLLSKRGFKLFRNLKLSTILKLIDAKTKVDETKVVKTYKKYKLQKVVNVLTTAINFINPYHWFKKLVVNPSINALINKICLICYSIVGEETYNIYSKQAFLNEDDELQNLLKEAEKDSSDIEERGIIVNDQE